MGTDMDTKLKKKKKKKKNWARPFTHEQTTKRTGQTNRQLVANKELLDDVRTMT